GVSSYSGINASPDLVLDGGGGWTSGNNQTANQFIKVLLSKGQTYPVYGFRMTPQTSVPFGTPQGQKDFDFRVSITSADDSAFTTVFSGTLAATTTHQAQEFDLTAPVNAKYVEFFFKNGYGGVMSVIPLEGVSAPQGGSLLTRFSRQNGNSGPTNALGLDDSNGISATSGNTNQFLKLALPGTGLWLIDQVALTPAQVGSDTGSPAKDFDILVSTTDSADSSFTTVFSGTLVNVYILQQYRFAPVPARYIKLLLKNNNGSTSKIGLQRFYVFSPQYGSTNARFMDRSTDPAGGKIVSWAWDFGDGSTSTSRDPVHVYAAPGTYTVTLKVTDDSAQSATIQT